MKSPKFFALFAIIFTAAVLLINSSAITETERADDTPDHHKVFELRTYTTFEGKLDDLHKRFADHTMRIFENHGMKNIGYWIPMDKENTLTYIISHESREQAEKNWQAFRSDPEWQEAYQASREDGPIVEKVESVFMTNTDYSPIK